MTQDKSITVMHLNCWSGSAPGFMKKFVELVARYDPDIICLNEVNYVENGEPRFMIGAYIGGIAEYDSLFAPRQCQWDTLGVYTFGAPNYCPWGNMILWRRNRFTRIGSRTEFTFGSLDSFDHKSKDKLPVNISGVRLQDRLGKDKKLLTVVNTHGWYGGVGYGKGDCPERRYQTNSWIEFCNNIGGSRLIFAGDLNLGIDTNALIDLEEGLRLTNVIRENKIETTI